MFSCESISLADEGVASLVGQGVIAKRSSKTGTFSWGPNNKLAIHCATGMAVDLLTATEENWWNYIVRRTGPYQSNIRIASEARKRGWKWTPYGFGPAAPARLTKSQAEPKSSPSSDSLTLTLNHGRGNEPILPF